MNFLIPDGLLEAQKHGILILSSKTPAHSTNLDDSVLHSPNSESQVLKETGGHSSKASTVKKSQASGLDNGNGSDRLEENQLRLTVLDSRLQVVGTAELEAAPASERSLPKETMDFSGPRPGLEY